MVNNLAEKVDERMSAKLGSLSIACAQLGRRKLSVIRSSGVSAIQGLLVLKSMEGQSGLPELSIISWVSAIQGCPLSGFHCITFISM